MADFVKELIKAGIRQGRINAERAKNLPAKYFEIFGAEDPRKAIPKKALKSFSKKADEAVKEIKEEDKDVQIISSGEVKMPKTSGPIQQAANARKQTASNSVPKATMGNQDVKSMIVRIANEVGVDPAIALAIAQQESGFNPNAVGDGGKSFGLFQIHSDFHPDYKGGTDPEANARYGLSLFKRLLDANGGSVNKAIWAYNAGQGNVNKGVLPKSTRQYINNIAALAPQFRQQGISPDAPVSQENRAIIQEMAGQGIPAAQASTQQVIQQPRIEDIQMPAVPELVGTNPQIDAIKAQLTEGVTDPRNQQLSMPSMYDALNAKYNELNNTINTQDPRYQGNLVQGPRYQVDLDALKARADFDRANGTIADVVAGRNSAQAMIDQQRMLYEQAMANQAGVPYEDYKAAMLDRQKQQIAAQAAQIDSQLKMAIQNENNVFRKQQLLAQLEQNNIEAQNAMAKLQYASEMDIYTQQVTGEQNAYLQQLKNTYATQQAEEEFRRQLMRDNYQNQLGIYRDQMKPQSSNPWQAINALNAMSGYNPQTMARMLTANPQLAQQTLGTSDPQTIGNILGTNQPQQAPSQGGFLDMLRRKAAGIGQDIRANEQ